MEINLTGATRIVIITKNYAIKIPRFFGYCKFYGLLSSVLHGWISNRSEYLWSRSETVNFLCPVQLSLFFSFIIIMKKAEPITNEEFNKLNLDSFNFNFGFEKKIDSFGKINNKITVIDYG